MDVSQAIKNRCCTRNFTDKKPTKEQLTAILEAGRLAPSWVNVQPWHFIVVQDPETIGLLGNLAFDQNHVANANTIIVCCGTLDSWEIDNYRNIILSRPNIPPERVNFLTTNPTFCPKLQGQDAVIFRTLEEVTYAVAFMTLEIENQGLAGCIVGGMGNRLTKSYEELYSKVADKLQLPKDFWIMTMLIIGNTTEDKPPKQRKNLDEVVSFNTYGNKY